MFDIAICDIKHRSASGPKIGAFLLRKIEPVVSLHELSIKMLNCA